MTVEIELKLAADIRRIDGDHTMGASELATALVEAGWTNVPAVVTFEVGEAVEVMVLGEWIPGKLSENYAHGLTSVHTAKGPVTIMAGASRIRKPRG